MKKKKGALQIDLLEINRSELGALGCSHPRFPVQIYKPLLGRGEATAFLSYAFVF